MPSQLKRRHNIRLRQADRLQPIDLDEADTTTAPAHLADPSRATQHLIRVGIVPAPALHVGRGRSADRTERQGLPPTPPSQRLGLPANRAGKGSLNHLNSTPT